VDINNIHQRAVIIIMKRMVDAKATLVTGFMNNYQTM